MGSFFILISIVLASTCSPGLVTICPVKGLAIAVGGMSYEESSSFRVNSGTEGLVICELEGLIIIRLERANIVISIETTYLRMLNSTKILKLKLTVKNRFFPLINRLD